VPNVRLYKIHERRKPSLLDYITPNRLDLIINVPAGYDRKELTDGYIIRRRATDVGIPLITNLQLAELFVKSIASTRWEDLKVEPYDRYVGPAAGWKGSGDGEIEGPAFVRGTGRAEDAGAGRDRGSAPAPARKPVRRRVRVEPPAQAVLA
jgi:hypothetical protein